MIELTLLASLLVEHNASHWEMSCSEWNQNRIEILSDKNLNSDAHEYLIDYLITKVSYDLIVDSNSLASAQLSGAPSNTNFIKMLYMRMNEPVPSRLTCVQ